MIVVKRGGLSLLAVISVVAGFPLVTRAADTSGDQGPKLEEVVVTAQKREERLMDVPVPVTALDAQTLVNTNQVKFLDYYDSIPNLTVLPSIASQTSLTIRGIGASGGYPTVGVLVDDAPFGTMTAGAAGNILPDIDPGDLARVEVLRGPQGALYGANTMGGLVKFVTLDPSMEALSGRVEAGLSSVYNGNVVGYDARGSVNIPVNDTFAIRASALHRQDPGYVDNVLTHIDGVNEEKANGGRLSALWRPSSVFSVKLSALFQDSKGDGSPASEVRPGLGDLQQSDVRGSGAYDREIQSYSATINARLGSAELTSVSAYGVSRTHDSWDYTATLGFLAPIFFPPATGTPVTDDNDDHKFSQEVRLSLPITEKVDWLLGGFYTHERTLVSQSILATDPLTGAIAGTLLTARNTSPQTSYWELAGFTDVTVHFTKRFQVQIGGRESHVDVPSTEGVQTGPLGSGVPSGTMPYSANVFTYLLTPQLKLSPDVMVYARLASGYRPGGTNCAQSGCTGTEVGATVNYSPDKTDNYELGLKGDFLDHALSLDASAFYIDWTDMQVGAVTANHGGYTSNAGRARSQGLELSAESRPLPGLELSGWIVWNDAHIVSFPSNSTVAAALGDRLPNSSRFSSNLSIDQDFPLSSTVRGFVGGSLAYIGQRAGAFPTVPPSGPAPLQGVNPAYAKVDLRAGIEHESWRVNLSALNVADRRGELTGGGPGAIPPDAIYFIQPRTIWLSVVKTF